MKHKQGEQKGVLGKGGKIAEKEKVEGKKKNRR